ncbi:MAG: quercetin dioxygenase-like cupin family protein [Patiriisocius sp.]|jgi:quercetin dioxygenase-like cupin family protein
MELSERFIRQFESEDFTYVYEVQDKPGATTPPRSHADNVSVYITDGSLTFTINGVDTVVPANERFDIPPNTEHSVTAGPQGAIYVVGDNE